MKTFRGCILALAVAVGLSGCATVQPGGVQHVVVLWLKKPGDKADRETLIRASEKLAAIPGVQRVEAGSCLPDKRPIVDSSYDVALAMRFESEAALRAYVDHPLHKAAVRDVLQPLTKRVQVYDFTIGQ